jgi:hypothetical protein
LLDDGVKVKVDVLAAAVNELKTEDRSDGSLDWNLH